MSTTVSKTRRPTANQASLKKIRIHVENPVPDLKDSIKAVKAYTQKSTQGKNKPVEEGTKKCTTCVRPAQPVNNFKNLATGKETKTCIFCRTQKRKCNDTTGCVKKNDVKLSEHIVGIKQSFFICYDCHEDFDGDGSDVCLWRKDGTNTNLNRIRSVKKRETELEKYLAICAECRRDRLRGQREEVQKHIQEQAKKEIVVVGFDGTKVKQKPSAVATTAKPKITKKEKEPDDNYIVDFHGNRIKKIK